jgi:hypothetical protein
MNPLAPVTKIVVLGFSVSKSFILYEESLLCSSSPNSFVLLYLTTTDASKALVLVTLISVG